jgi:hypothetical protein
MRHALLILLIPMTLLLSGCCSWDEDSEPDYHELRVNNHTDLPISVRYTGVMHWGDDQATDVDRKVTVSAGGYKNIDVARDSEVEIKADYNHIIHWFSVDADSYCSCDLTIDMQIEDFVPAMPVSNG